MYRTGRPTRVFHVVLPGLWTICLGFLLAVGVQEGRAQSTSTGRVTGLVTDQQNAAVAGAEAVLVDTATNARQAMLTHMSGAPRLKPASL